MENLDIDLLLRVVKTLGIMVLENGGETYRAEDVISNVCKAYTLDEVDVFALPTGLFIQLTYEGKQYMTAIKRVKKRGINLIRLDTANRISRRLAARDMTLNEAAEQLQTAQSTQALSRPKTAAAAAVSMGCFSVLFGGGWFEFLTAALAGGMIQTIISSFRREDMFHFIISLIGGFLSAAVAVLAVSMLGRGSIDAIVSGAMMLLVPGLALINAIRDTMRGDLVSGTARMGEVFVISMAIAAGVSVALGIWGLFGGGAL